MERGIKLTIVQVDGERALLAEPVNFPRPIYDDVEIDHCFPPATEWTWCPRCQTYRLFMNGICPFHYSIL